MYSFVKIIYTENMDKLNRLWGHVLPTGSVSIPAGYTMEWIGGYEAAEASESVDDIEITASFTPNGMLSVPLVDELRLTSVRVELRTAFEAVANTNRNRHVYGVRELVACLHEPYDAFVIWQESGTGNLRDGNDCDCVFECPILADTCGLKALFRGGEYTPLMSVVEPQDILCNTATMLDYSTPHGVAGRFGMSLSDIYVLPRNVSFARISIEEIPCENGEHSGYFADASFANKWNHSIANGAGRWRTVFMDNMINAIDKVTCSNCPPPWASGYLSWDIPVGWSTNGAVMGDAPIKEIPVDIQSVTTISDSGTVTMSKLGHYTVRNTNDVIIVDDIITKGDVK